MASPMKAKFSLMVSLKSCFGELEVNTLASNDEITYFSQKIKRSLLIISGKFSFNSPKCVIRINI